MTTIVSFSSRKDGNCNKIRRFIQENITNSSGYSFSDFKIEPCGNCEYECFRNRLSCPHTQDMENKLLEAICRSEKAYFIVPNYCDYPCGNFFIFNERSNCFFQGREDLLEQYLRVPKEFIVVSNTGQENFLQAFAQHVTGQPKVLFLSARAFGKRSIDGDLLPSEAVEQVIQQWLIQKM